MEEVDSVCDKRERSLKSSESRDKQTVKEFNAETIIDAFFNRIKEDFLSFRKKFLRILRNIFLVGLFLVILLFLQAVLYKDVTEFFKTFSVSIGIAEVLFVICKKRIEEKLKRKIIALPKINKIISVVLIVSIASTGLWQIPSVKAFVSDVALSVVNYVGKKIHENSDESNYEEVETTQLLQTQYNADMEFIINDYDTPSESYSKIFEKVYFYVNQNSGAESILKHFNDIYGVKLPVVEGTRFYEIQAKEDYFISKQVKGVDYKEKNGINQEWYKMLPHENELLEVIRYQEEYAESYPCYVIFLRLSNNYQRLGNEYLRQKASISTIKYYYYMSLIYDYECIKYAENKSHFNSSLSRVYYRFKDIVSFCKITSSEREKARFVMEGLDNYKYLSP